MTTDTAAVPSTAVRELESLLAASDTECFDESNTGSERGLQPPPPNIEGYELSGELGRGGMGAVYRARDLQLHRDVAIKVLRGDHVGREDLQARFIAEAQIHAQLQHPGVAPLHAQGETTDGRPYFAMKVVQGRTLAELLRERTDPADDRPRFLKIFEQICQTLAYAHARRVIHRDLKPGNVMVGAFGEVQVMDWGLAKVLASESNAPLPPRAVAEQHGDLDHTAPLRTLRSEHKGDAFATRAAVGTLAYMPPEQAAGAVERVDERADVFGLGAILTEILTGAPPYQPDTATRMLNQAARGTLAEAMARLDSCGADAELIDLARRCLAMQPYDRPRDAGVVAAAVTSYLDSAEARLRQAELARAASEVKAREERRRRKLLIGLGATFLIAAGAVVALVVGAVYQGKLQAANKELTSTNGELRNTQGQLEQAQADLKRVTYFRLISLANSDWWNDNGGRASAVLADCPPALRHWEWFYLQRLMDSRILQVPVGQTCAAFSSDGRYVVGGCADGSIKVWSAKTGDELLILKGHDGFVADVAFSPDGSRIVSGGADWTIKLWDVERRELLRTLSGHTLMVNSVEFSRDGKKILSGSRDYSIRIWDAETGEVLRTIGSLKVKAHDFDVKCAAFSPDGKHIVSGGGDSLVKIWNAENGEEVRSLPGHSGWVQSVVYSNDGRYVISGSRDKTMKIWDTSSGEVKATLEGHSGNVTSVSFNPSADRVLSASTDMTLRIWDVESGASVAALKAHGRAVLDAEYSKDGKQIVSSSSDGTVRIWDAADRGTSRVLKVGDQIVESVTFSPNGRQLVTRDRENVVKIFDVERGEVLRSLEGSGAVYSPDGNLTVSVGRDLKIFDATTGLELRTLSGVGGLTYSPDGKWIVGAGGERELIIWDAASGERIKSIAAHVPQILCIACSPNGKHIVVGGSDGKAYPGDENVKTGAYALKVYDASSGEELLTLDGHRNAVRSVAFRPDGKQIVSTSLDGSVRTWDAGTGKEIRALLGHNSTPEIAKFSPDGKRIVSSSGDGVVKVWDATTSDEALSFKEHSGWATHVTFSPNGKHIVSSGADGTLHIWTAAGDWDGAPPAIEEPTEEPAGSAPE